MASKNDRGGPGLGATNTSRYRSIIGPPPELGPADYAGARAYADRIQLAIEKGGWTRAERQRLYSLAKKWRNRAEGRDVRFNLHGNRQGGLTAGERRKVKELSEVGESIEEAVAGEAMSANANQG